MERVIAIYKKSYSGLSPSIWWLSLVMLINRSGTMVIPFMTLYLTKSLHYSNGQAGIVMAFFGAGAICGGLIGGKLSDMFGFLPLQIASLAGGGLMFVLLGQMTSLPLICAFTFLLSIVNESFRPANAAAIGYYSRDDNRTRCFSLNRLAINLGWALGGTLGGFIAASNYHLLFWIDACSNITAALLLLLLFSPEKIKRRDAGKEKQEEESVFRSVYADKIYLVFVMLTMMYAYVFFQLFTTLPLYYDQRLHLKESFIGSLMAMSGIIIALFEMVIIYYLEGKRDRLHYVFYGTMLVGLSFVLFNIFPGTAALAVCSMLMLTIGEILSMPFMNSFWIARTNQRNRGQYAGLYTVAWATAQVLGPSTGGMITERYGFDTLWWIMGIVSLFTLAGFKWLQHKARIA